MDVTITRSNQSFDMIKQLKAELAAKDRIILELRNTIITQQREIDELKRPFGSNSPATEPTSPPEQKLLLSKIIESPEEDKESSCYAKPNIHLVTKVRALTDELITARCKISDLQSQLRFHNNDRDNSLKKQKNERNSKLQSRFQQAVDYSRVGTETSEETKLPYYKSSESIRTKGIAYKKQLVPITPTNEQRQRKKTGSDLLPTGSFFQRSKRK